MKASASILLVEDTKSLSIFYCSLLSRQGYIVDVVETAKEARNAIRDKTYALILLDLLLPDETGLGLLQHIVNTQKNTGVLVITANGSITIAVDAMRVGASDFLIKPFSDKRLLNAVAMGVLSSKKGSKNATGRIKPVKANGFGEFLGSSEAMQKIYQMIRDVSYSKASVFIMGESGTGKELCAQAVHDMSLRARAPFVPLNCGAIPKELLESEVFGHLKGSFTGAIANKKGAAEFADGGTLFLDEICEMDLDLQTKLLRFLQTSKISPVGAVKDKSVNVRIVCATNRDPYEEIRCGRLREDLFYRIYVLPIYLPPLRERGKDVLEIIAKKLPEFAKEEGKQFVRISGEAESMLMAAEWPGNVRQLLNVLRNAVVLNDGLVIEAYMLEPMLKLMEQREKPIELSSKQEVSVENVARIASTDSTQTLEEVERTYIIQVLNNCGGSIPETAKILNIAPSTLYRKLEKWSISDNSPLH